ncbi:MAG: GNAT family N-acetyltransferase [Clostridiales Family XIII bacterium]|jgi:N-acetylglutamate synthase-like GNAT family acetyltransferase|nr:GNAT family N-acetyltransferase [Clostridiales Family XIII bacterium]
MVKVTEQGAEDRKDAPSFVIAATEDYEGLVPFFIENGLEFSEEDETPTDIVKCWSAKDGRGVLVGGCVLARREGEFICDGIAVSPDFRAGGLGKRLLDVLVAEAAARGGAHVYLVARAPKFFAKYGFVAVERKDAPKFFECFTCPQYVKTCFPEVMKTNRNLGSYSGRA